MMKFALCLCLLATASAAPKGGSLLQTWQKALDSTSETPVTRVVNLLKEIRGTLKKDMDEDEDLYKKLSCWCNTNTYDKGESIDAAKAKIEELESTIESLSARSAELKTEITDTETELESDKETLAKATAIREKQAEKFHQEEMDAIQAIENMKSALLILSKHHKSDATDSSGLTQNAGSFLSLLSVRAKKSLRPSAAERQLDEFVGANSVGDVDEVVSAPARPEFVQQQAAADSTGMSVNDVAVVKKAMEAARAFMQTKNGYYPANEAQSGEIVGIMKQLDEEMKTELKESQARETDRASGFAELRESKTAEIDSAEKSAERKEDELATTDNNLAEAKEDLGQKKVQLEEDMEFVATLSKTCKTADEDFEARKEARLEELKAVSDTIEILVADEAKDAMSGTFNFLQVATKTAQGGRARREKAAAVLRRVAAKTGNAELSVLATGVQLDAFTKVKKAITDMVEALNQQQADEVKKADYCKSSLQENEMATMKAEDLKADLEAKINELASKIEQLTRDIASNSAMIAELQVNLQRASINRKNENHDFQKTQEDQTLTIEVLNKALDRLSQFYDKADFLQKSTKGRQTPPMAQKEYKPSKGAGGVVAMIEKLIYDAREVKADSKKAEMESQVAYEETVASTNASVLALQKESATKSKEKARTGKDKALREDDLSETQGELDRLAKYNADLHAECDYVLKNFDVRQQARAQEIEALQQATQILSGANMS